MGGAMCTVTINGLKVLVVSRWPSFRTELKAMLGAANTIAATVFEADWSLGSVRACCERTATEEAIDLVIVDLGGGDSQSLADLALFRVEYGAVPAVAVVDAADEDMLRRAYDLGVAAFVTQGSNLNTYCAAIQVGLAGGIYLPTDAPAETPGTAAWILARSSGNRIVENDSLVLSIRSLTPRQKDVLSLVVEGKPNKEICRTLCLAPGTVKNHVAMILKRLNARNRAHAVSVVTRETLQAGAAEMQPAAKFGRS